MGKREETTTEILDLAPGLWIWRIEHPAWDEDADWQKVVTCVCVDTGDERWLIDPLLPPDDFSPFWDRLAEKAPTAVAIISPDHVRCTFDDRRSLSVDVLVGRYDCRGFGPAAFDPDDIPPSSEIETIMPGQDLPGFICTLRDPRGWNETPLWIPHHRTLVFADTLTERGGELRVWMSPNHEVQALPALRSMLRLPFERVIVSHGQPVHSRDGYIRALELPQWPAGALHQAAYRGDYKLVQRLVDDGSDVCARDERFGELPLYWAELGNAEAWPEKRNHRQIIAYLAALTESASCD